MRVRIIGRNAHRVDVIDLNCAEKRAQNLGYANDPGREIETDELRIRTTLCGCRIVPVCDQDLRVVPGPSEHFVDLGVDELML